MNPKQFLTIGGVVLILVGILGFAGLIGPSEKDSIFGAAWWFDNAENWAHTILGVIALIAAFAISSNEAQKWLVVVVGLGGIAFGVINLFLAGDTPNFYGANLENPADTILHFAVGLWALLAAFFGKSE